MRPVTASKEDLQRAWDSPVGDPYAPSIWIRDHGRLRAMKPREVRRMARNADVSRLWTRPGRQRNRVPSGLGSP